MNALKDGLFAMDIFAGDPRRGKTERDIKGSTMGYESITSQSDLSNTWRSSEWPSAGGDSGVHGDSKTPTLLPNTLRFKRGGG